MSVCVCVFDVGLGLGQVLISWLSFIVICDMVPSHCVYDGAQNAEKRPLSLSRCYV